MAKTNEGRNEKVFATIMHLVKSTQDGRMRWAVRPAESVAKSHPPSDEDYVDQVFEARDATRLIRLLTRKVWVEPPTHPIGIAASLGPLLGKTHPLFKPHWKDMIVVELIDGVGNTLWNFPYDPSFGDLLSTVQYHASGAKDYMEEIYANYLQDEKKGTSDEGSDGKGED